MKNWNSFGGAPIRRALSLTAGLLVAGCADSGLLEPGMKAYHNCFSPITYTASSLHDLIGDSTLYYDYMQSADSTTPDYWMLKQHGLVGYLTNYAPDPDSQPLPPDRTLRFTGTVYKRVPSMPEKILGAGEERLFYEVAVDKSRLLLPAFMFPEPPFPQCSDAQEAVSREKSHSPSKLTQFVVRSVSGKRLVPA